MKHYTISISPALTPAEWFFHVRNMQDEVYQLGYDMRDFADLNEDSRMRVLGAKTIKAFSGIVHHPEREADYSELKSCIEKYFKDRKYIHRIEMLDLNDPTKDEVKLLEIPRLTAVSGNAEHYYIEFEPSVSPAEWFFHIRNLADILASHGYEMRDFHDGFVLDREQILRVPQINFFEGFVYKAESINIDDMWQLVNVYFGRHNLTLKMHRN
jgi:hypothetical protein